MLMQIRLLIFVSTLSLVIACTSRSDFDPDRSMDAGEQTNFVQSVIRYAARSPEGITFAERFYAQYDSFYLEQAGRHRLDAYSRVGNRGYFLLSRNAPSLTEKKVGIGGYVIFTEDGKVNTYREVFRTWKMVPDTLARRAELLFSKMVKGESLESFETRFSGGTEYIEFPDERVWFDTTQMIWTLRPVPSDTLK